jgi:hypothetical protein
VCQVGYGAFLLIKVYKRVRRSQKKRTLNTASAYGLLCAEDCRPFTGQIENGRKEVCSLDRAAHAAAAIYTLLISSDC